MNKNQRKINKISQKVFNLYKGTFFEMSYRNIRISMRKMNKRTHSPSRGLRREMKLYEEYSRDCNWNKVVLKNDSTISNIPTVDNKYI